MAPPEMMGIYPSDSIQEVSHSLSLDPLGQGAADLMAVDVEYRIHQIIQEARKFMVHGKRQTLIPEDVEYAMEALNVEPILVPPKSLPSQSFVAVSVPSLTGGPSQSQQVYHVPDEEIDFASYLKKPLPSGISNSAGVSWKAHWLAVEGVQPAIPENPASSSRAGPSRQPPVPQTGPSALRASARTHLPQELQLYFTRLTAALIPSASSLPLLPGQPDQEGILPDSERHRQAALSSVREDQAMAGILVYFVRWLNESIQRCLLGSLGTLGCLIDCLGALLGNDSVFLEPYIHQLLPPLMSILLTVPLGPTNQSVPPPGPQPTTYDIRSRSADVLGKITKTYGPMYPTLVPRIVTTLTGVLNSNPAFAPVGSLPAGRYEGAVLGLGALGPSTVRSTIWGKGGEGLKKLDGLCEVLFVENKKGRGLLKAAEAALHQIILPDQSNPAPSTTPDEIAQAFGSSFIGIFTKKKASYGNEAIRMRKQELEKDTNGKMEVE